MQRLAGKVAIVTGAGQGVGQGIAYALAREGAAVAVVGRTRKKVEETHQEIARRGGRSIALECDVKSQAAIQQCIETVVETFGGINILINNAQEVPVGHLLSLTDETLNAGWESGPLATFRFMTSCHPYLMGGGSIINLGTSASKRWDAGRWGAYAAVKEAIRALSRAAACEWGKDGIRTNVIIPLAASPAFDQWQETEPAEAEAFMASLPMGKIGECEHDIGDFVVALCSEDSRYVNGQTIAIDGGQMYIG